MAVASEYNNYPVQRPAARVALRDFALAIYQVDGVAPSCLQLQDRLDLDVNVLLLAAYVGAIRGQIMTPAELETVRALTDPWRSEVVRPLRAVRRGLKTGPAPAPNPQTAQLRKRVAKAELDAELIELDVLGRWADELGTPTAPGDHAERARAAMEVAAHAYFTAALSDEDVDALAVIATAAAHVAGCDG